MSDPPSSWLSSGSFQTNGISMCPDSLNQEITSSVTGSTRVEFLIGSPTKQFFTGAPQWTSRYFDSIDTTSMLADSFLTDEFPPRTGEAMAECDSLDSHEISNDS